MQVEGRVLSVRPLEAGGYGITIGPGPDMHYVAIDAALPVGTLIRATGNILREIPLRPGKPGTLTVMDGEVSVEGAPLRVVAPEWLERVQLAHAELYRYQVDGAAWIAQRLSMGKGALLADEPGLGKTRQVLAGAIAAEYFPLIIVCPTTLKPNWQRECEKVSVPLEIQILSGGSGFVYPAHVYILNYDILRAREKQLMHLGARAIVFDEGHTLKEPRPSHAHRAAVATRIAKAIGRSIVLTGTPMLNRPSELWRLLHLADPAEWPSFELYHERYCRAPSDEEREQKTRRIVTTYGHAERVDELRARVDPVMLRRTKDEVQIDLPSKSRRSLVIEIGPEYRERYELAQADLVKWFREQFDGLRESRAHRYEALMRLGVLRRIAAFGKLQRAVPDYLYNWFDRPVRSPLVIFGYHKAVLAHVERVAEHLGLTAAVIRADLSEQARQRAIDTFQVGYADVFIAPILAAGVGINLHRAADALFLERTFVPLELIQAEDRLHRIGQEKPVVITYLDAAKTIDEHMAAVCDGKLSLIQQLVDGAPENSETAMIREVLNL